MRPVRVLFRWFLRRVGVRRTAAKPQAEPVALWKPGDLVRFDMRESDLARLEAPVAGGWRALKCRGGYTFVYDRRFGTRAFRQPSEADIHVWQRSARHRQPLSRDADRRA